MLELIIRRHGRCRIWRSSRGLAISKPAGRLTARRRVDIAPLDEPVSVGVECTIPNGGRIE